jgi:uncharacterized membrane protein YfhO
MAKQPKKVVKDPIPKPKPEAAPVAKTSTPSAAKDFFDNLGNKAPLVALGLILLVAFIVFKDFILFDKVYLFKDIGSDTINFYYPYMYASADYIHSHGLPQWYFNSGMGQNMISSFLGDPFNIFLYMAGKDHIMGGMIFKELMKIVLGGFIFFYYLKTIKLSDYTAIIGCLFFSFCSFMIIGSGWYVYSTEAFDIALLLLAFELLYTRGKWLLFPIAVFLIAVVSPIDLYICAFLLSTYTLLRLYQNNDFNVKNIGTIFAKMIGLGLLGILISAPFLIEAIVQIMESPRGNGTNSYAHILSSLPVFETADKFQLGTSVMRFFSGDMMGNGNSFKGWQNYMEAPMFYCGLPCLLLMPQVFRFLDKKVKIFFIVFISVWLLPIIFPWFRHAFYLFAGDYFRSYSVIVAFIFMYYSLHALEMIMKTRKVNVVALVVTIVLLFILLNYPYFPDKEYVNSSILAFASFMLIVYAVLIFFTGRPNSPAYVKYIFFFAVILEVTYFSNVTVNEREALPAADLSQKTGYNDYSVDAISFIKKNDASFYRIDKTYGSAPSMHMSLNDGMVQGYKGTTGYYSFNQPYYIKYLQLMGISNRQNELESRWANGLAFRPILESENQVKYILAKNNINPIWKIACDSLGAFGDVKVYRNKFVLPFGYTHSNYIKESVFDRLTNIQKDFVSLRACVINDQDLNKVAGLKEFQLKDTIPAFGFSADIYRQYINDLAKDTMVVDKFGELLISGKINSSEDKMMYLSIPFDPGWLLKVDGQPIDKIVLDGGMTGVMIKKGQHNIEMSFHLRYFPKALYLSLAGAVLYLALLFFVKNRKKTPAVVS